MVWFIPLSACYVVVGVAYFGKSPFFSDVRRGVATLFAMMLGDSFCDITNALAAAAGNRLSAIIFVFSYVFMFMMAVNNVMIAIIKEEFDKRKILIFEEEKMIKMKK
jgi:hypothetical protein